MNPSYIFLPLLALLLAGVLLLIYYRMALRFALQAIDPQRMNYGAVLRQEMERNQLDPDRMDVKYDKLFLVNQHGQELTARLYLTPSQTDRYILFLHGYNYPWIGVLKYLPMLLRLGFNVLVPDLQAQGESQGSYITFGALESDDCLEWLEQIHGRLTGNREKLRLVYQPSTEPEDFERVLLSKRDQDIRMKMSGTGPHRDDFLFMVGEVDIRKFGSQGQQRTAALSLKLAEIELVRQSIGDEPVLLLDDVLSELDSSRQNYLLDCIKDIQTVITCTGLDEFVNHRFNIDRIFKVTDGTVDFVNEVVG